MYVCAQSKDNKDIFAKVYIAGIVGGWAVLSKEKKHRKTKKKKAV